MKEKVRRLVAKFGIEALAFRLGISVRTLQGYLAGRAPNRSAKVIIDSLARE